MWTLTKDPLDTYLVLHLKIRITIRKLCVGWTETLNSLDTNKFKSPNIALLCFNPNQILCRTAKGKARR